MKLLLALLLTVSAFCADRYGGDTTKPCSANPGLISYSVSKLARSGSTVTVTTTAAHAIPAHAVVKISGTTLDGGSFNTTTDTMDEVLTVADNTHFTITKAGTATAETSDTGTITLDRFYSQKIGDRWYLCTPEGNSWTMRAVYHISYENATDYQGSNPATVVEAKYPSGPSANWILNWIDAQMKRISEWGFNAIGEYSIHYTKPSVSHWQWPGDGYPPTKLPFVSLVWPSRYCLTNTEAYAADRTKDLAAALNPAVLVLTKHLVDWWDDNFRQFAEGHITQDAVLADLMQGTNSEYMVGISIDETDDLVWALAGPDYPVIENRAVSSGKNGEHAGALTLITAPTQAGYADTEVKAKTALSTWLSTRYSADIAALNTAWGSHYTTFGSAAGGWGVGTGLLDEDGTCPSRGAGACDWMPTDYKTLAGVSATMHTDLDAFLYYTVEKYYDIIETIVRANYPGFMLMSSGPIGSWGAPAHPEVLQAASGHVDMYVLSGLPLVTAQCTDCTDIQARMDFQLTHGGDKPWLNWEGFTANTDSYMSGYVKGDVFATQEDRGAIYAVMSQGMISASVSGTHPWVGFQWWELYDSRIEQLNWGLATPRDNAYDGVEAVTGTVACSAPLAAYSCGGELAQYGAPYGDFITSVKAANALWLNLQAAPASHRIQGRTVTTGRTQ